MAKPKWLGGGNKGRPEFAQGGQGNTKIGDDVWSLSEIEKKQGANTNAALSGGFSNSLGDFYYRPVKDEPGNYHLTPGKAPTATPVAAPAKKSAAPAKKSGGGGGGGGGDSVPAIVPPNFDYSNSVAAALAPKPKTDLEKRAEAFYSKGLDLSEKWLRGELSDDVTRAVRQATSEAADVLGLGTGQKARNLTARDLGLSSQALQEKGLAAGTSISGQIEAIREFDRTYELNVQNTIMNARQLDLSQSELQNKLQLQASQMAINKSLALSQLALSQQGQYMEALSTAYQISQASKNPEDGTNFMTSLYGNV